MRDAEPARDAAPAEPARDAEPAEPQAPVPAQTRKGGGADLDGMLAHADDALLALHDFVLHGDPANCGMLPSLAAPRGAARVGEPGARERHQAQEKRPLVASAAHGRAPSPRTSTTG